ncbi:SurA N-terminal domain-containing protein [Gammaproteobacteria bacterium AS21]
MLQGIRDNSKGVIAKVIVGFIVLTFALFGVESLVSLSQGSNAPATVNGEEISEADLFQATQLQRRSILAQMGENADPSSIDENLLSGMVLDSLIQEKALLLNAQENDLRISEAMIDDVILKTAEFQVSGAFNVAQFDNIIRNIGYTRFTYREYVRKNLILEQQRAALSLSSFVLPSAVNKIVELEKQTRDVRYFAMPIATVRALTEVSDAEVEAEFEKQKSTLKTTEQVVVDYVELNIADVAKSIDVSDEEINTQYQQVVASFESQEQRQAAHILVEVNDDVSDEQALEKINGLRARIDQGEDFASLAKEASDDFGNAEIGGDLGFVSKGVFEQSIEDELFALAEGEVSQAVEAESGYHLIKVSKVIKTNPATLAESKDKIISDLKESKAEDLYLEHFEKLTDLAFISSDLEDIAAELDLPIKTLPAFDRSGNDDPLTQNSKLIREAFSDELIKQELNSAPIEISRSHAVVLNVKEHLPVRAKTFDEVKDDLKEQLLTRKASEQLEQRAKQAIVDIKQTGDATESAADFELQTQLGLTRVSAQAPPQIVRKAFTLAQPVESKVTVDTATLADGSLAIIILDKVNNVKADEASEQEFEAYQNLLSNRFGQQSYQVFQQQVFESAEIEKL